MLSDVGCDAPPLWCISEQHRPHGRGWHPIREAGRKPGSVPNPPGRSWEQSSYAQVVREGSSLREGGVGTNARVSRRHDLPAEVGPSSGGSRPTPPAQNGRGSGGQRTYCRLVMHPYPTRRRVRRYGCGARVAGTWEPPSGSRPRRTVAGGAGRGAEPQARGTVGWPKKRTLGVTPEIGRRGPRWSA